jgi:hypothetical protein
MDDMEEPLMIEKTLSVTEANESVQETSLTSLKLSSASLLLR